MTTSDGAERESPQKGGIVERANYSMVPATIGVTEVAAMEYLDFIGRGDVSELLKEPPIRYWQAPERFVFTQNRI